MRWAGHVAHTEEMINAYKIFVMKPEGKRPFGRPGYTRDNNFDNFEAGLQNSVLMLGTDCVQLRALVNTAMRSYVQIKLRNLLVTITCFTRRISHLY
jgi:hypothetical protein